MLLSIWEGKYASHTVHMIDGEQNTGTAPSPGRLQSPKTLLLSEKSNSPELSLLFCEMENATHEVNIHLSC